MVCSQLSRVTRFGSRKDCAPRALLAGKYRLERLLAVEDTGAIYAATDIVHRIAVTVNTLRADEVAAATRFQREAMAVSALGHENICRVTEVGRATDGALYQA